jgi:hypothetical protein
MSSVLSTEVGAAPLPVTGAGPFSILIGIVGIASVGFGALLTRIARKDEATAGVVDDRQFAGGWSPGAIAPAVMADAVRWLDAQLAGSQRMV